MHGTKELSLGGDSSVSTVQGDLENLTIATSNDHSVGRDGLNRADTKRAQVEAKDELLGLYMETN